MNESSTFADVYRPKRFKQVVGQVEATTRLLKIVKTGQARHVVFHGPPGSGKTSLARIYANAFECTALEVGERPCRECERCLEFMNGSFCYLEFIKVDLASARDAAALTSAPMSCNYRLLFFDEAQRMTQQAFDAFLQAMENPNSSVKYLFATTKLLAIPDTLRQRADVIETVLLRQH